MAEGRGHRHIFIFPKYKLTQIWIQIQIQIQILHSYLYLFAQACAIVGRVADRQMERGEQMRLGAPVSNCYIFPGFLFVFVVLLGFVFISIFHLRLLNSISNGNFPSTLALTRDSDSKTYCGLVVPNSLCLDLQSSVSWLIWDEPDCMLWIESSSLPGNFHQHRPSSDWSLFSHVIAGSTSFIAQVQSSWSEAWLSNWCLVANPTIKFRRVITTSHQVICWWSWREATSQFQDYHSDEEDDDDINEGEGQR